MFWTVILSIPYWIVEIYASKSISLATTTPSTHPFVDFAYFHNGPQIFKKTRPLELLFRDPWWIMTTIYLFIVIKTQYEMTLKEIVRISPRFGVMLASMMIAIVFVICDVLSVTNAMRLAGDTGINPFWKIAFVFKCLTDSVILDDFKIALDRLRAFKISRLGSFSGDFSDRRSRNDGNLVETWEKAEQDAKGQPRGRGQIGDLEKGLGIQSPDGEIIQSTKFSNYDPARKSRKERVNDCFSPSDNTDLHVAPEDLVSSAIEDTPMRTLEAAHYSHKDDHEWVEDVGSRAERRMTAESDYAAALRDLQGPASAASRSSPNRNSQPC